MLLEKVTNNQKVQKQLPPMRFELMTPSLRDWCSTTELKGLLTSWCILHQIFYYHSCASSRQPKKNISDQGLVNFSPISNKGKALIMIVQTHLPLALTLPQFNHTVRLAKWSKAWDLSSHNRKIAWVRTPHLTKWFCTINFFSHQIKKSSGNVCVFWISLANYFGVKL